MRARRVAVLADVHGNAVALAAVLAELEREQPDAIVHCGDLTWGPLPAETSSCSPGRGVLFVRGNADRAVTELAERLQDPGAEATPRERWMVEHHDAPLRALLAAFPATVELEVDGLGDVLFCHGSPRSDEELVTVETPESRLADAIAGTSAGDHRDGAYARQLRAAACSDGRSSTPAASACPTRARPAPTGRCSALPARAHGTGSSRDRAPADGVRPRRDRAPLPRERRPADGRDDRDPAPPADAGRGDRACRVAGVLRVMSGAARAGGSTASRPGERAEPCLSSSAA